MCGTPSTDNLKQHQMDIMPNHGSDLRTTPFMRFKDHIYKAMESWRSKVKSYVNAMQGQLITGSFAPLLFIGKS
jgi:hypothetical protein